MRCRLDLAARLDPTHPTSGGPFAVCDVQDGRLACILLRRQGWDIRFFLDNRFDGKRVDDLPVVHLDAGIRRLLPSSMPVLVGGPYWVRHANAVRARGFTDVRHFGSPGGSDEMQETIRALDLFVSRAVIAGSASLANRIRALRPAIEPLLTTTGPLGPPPNPRSISMVAAAVHAIAMLAVRATDGVVLEIGTYVGGLSCSIGAAGPSLHVMVETGGADTAHPWCPTDDILADLEANYAFHVRSVPHRILRATAQDSATVAAVRATLDGRRASVLVIDADGDLAGTVPLYADLLAPGCLVLIDDFIDIGNIHPKGHSTRAFVYEAIARRDLVEIDVVGFGTWVGVWRPHAT